MKIEKKITKSLECDVLVVGGGVAGYGAAMGAAQAGAKVVITEQNGYLGGTATAGLVAPFMTCLDSLGKEQLIKGVFEQLILRLKEEDGAILPQDCCKCDSYSGYKLYGHLGTTPFDKEALKYVMEQTLIESGVCIKYHYTFIQAIKSDRKITSCVFATKNGFYRVDAKEVIDCTGDSMVCEDAGGAYFYSDEKGAMQPVSTFFTIDGVDKAALDSQLLKSTDPSERALMDLVKLAKDRGEFPCGTQKVRLFEQPNGIWVVNMCQIDNPFDVNDPDLITEAEIEGRKQARIIFKFLKKYVKGLENIRLLQTSESVGIRESRRIVGEYVLTIDDVTKARKFDDAVVKLANSVDVHTSGAVDYKTYENTSYYTIPYRALVHRDFDNVWSAGKTVSADRYALGAVRVMPPAMAMGQAAGVAASIAVKRGCKAKEVPYDILKETLVKQGVNL